MAHSATPQDWLDQALVHHFIRTLGRRPTPAELARHQKATGPRNRLSDRARRGMAQLINRF
jgi:hypothetical protein